MALSAIGIVHGAAAGAEEPAVIDAQAAPTSGPAPAKNAQSMLDHMFARLFTDPARQRLAVAINAAMFDRYAGTFRVDSGLGLTISREGDRLFAQLTGQPKVRIYSHSETEFFFATAIDAWISFRTAGQADSLIFHQNGRDSAARRVDAAEAQAAEAAFWQRRTATGELVQPKQLMPLPPARMSVSTRRARQTSWLSHAKANGSLRN
jgi:Domain of unknown function (DUF3471)